MGWEASVLWSNNSPRAGDPWVTTMCTTMMVLGTIALILRQRFSNKIQPWVLRNIFECFIFLFVNFSVGHQVWLDFVDFTTRKRKMLNTLQYKLYKMLPPSSEHSHVQIKKNIPQKRKKENAHVWEKVWKRKERLVCTIDLKLPLWLFLVRLKQQCVD